MHGTRVSEDTEITVPLGDLDVRIMTPVEREESGDRISFWWGLTSAAVALSGHLALMGNLSGIRLAELGCGLGLAGVTAGCLGASVTFTDYMPEALYYAEKNARLNGLEPNCTRFIRLDWEDPCDLGTFNMLVGSEVVYDYFTHGSLVNLLDRMLIHDGTILLAERKRLAVSRFMGRLVRRGFTCSEATVNVSIPGFPGQEITLFSLQRTPA